MRTPRAQHRCALHFPTYLIAEPAHNRITTRQPSPLRPFTALPADQHRCLRSGTRRVKSVHAAVVESVVDRSLVDRRLGEALVGMDQESRIARAWLPWRSMT
jgi:hypothetical protein